ncbi:hypothetical protein WR25_08609 [Diploscapter pachys]|uniref:Uncharacterized protein n=1 Tax=Diploscapter pachys TaxID=2018661 RepID=A0A2A2LGD3_9BILA|nr:hypothetical protein WR25_08609 [Diploscapter pachys]
MSALKDRRSDSRQQKYAATFYCGEYEMTSHCSIVRGNGGNPPAESLMSIIAHNHVHFKETMRANAYKYECKNCTFKCLFMYEAHEHKCGSGQADMHPVPISPEAIRAEISFYRYMNAHFIVAENFRPSVSSIPDLNSSLPLPGDYSQGFQNYYVPRSPNPYTCPTSFGGRSPNPYASSSMLLPIYNSSGYLVSTNNPSRAGMGSESGSQARILPSQSITLQDEPNQTRGRTMIRNFTNAGADHFNARSRSRSPAAFSNPSTDELRVVQRQREMNRVESRGTVKVPPSNARGGFLADDPKNGSGDNDREWQNSQTPAPLRNARSFMDESTNRPRGSWSDPRRGGRGRGNFRGRIRGNGME